MQLLHLFLPIRLYQLSFRMNLYFIKESLFSKRILIGCIILSLAIALKAQHISHTPKNVEEYFNYKPMKSVLDVLQSKYNFKIGYDSIDLGKSRLTYLFNKTSPDDVMRIVADQAKLKYRKEEDGSYSLFNPASTVSIENSFHKPEVAAKRKHVTIRGIVKDVGSGETLPYVSIYVPTTQQGTSTNVDGYFTLFDVPTDTSGLDLSYIGYQSKKFFLRPDLDLEKLVITLEPQSELLEEIQVTANHEELLRANEKISMLKLSPVKIASLPAVGERDVMRSFQLMPGVSAANENSSGLYVRGGTPDQTLVVYDGFSVYHVDHLFGFFSAFNPNAIKDVQLFKGGFESKFGGRIASVAEITGKEGNTKQPNVGINAGFLAYNGEVEVPIGDKITTLFAYRRSYQSGLYNKIFNTFNSRSTQVPNVGQTRRNGGFGGGRFNFTTTTPKSFFYDLNGRVTFKPTSKDIISASIYNGTDDMDNSRTNNISNFGGQARNFGFNVSDITNWGNTGGSLKWSHRFSDKFYANGLLSFSHYFSNRDRSNKNTFTDSTGAARNNSTGSVENNDLKDYSGKLDIEYHINKNNTIEAGFNVTNNYIKYNYTQNDTIQVINRNNQGITNTFYIQDRIKMNKLLIIPGIRIDEYSPLYKFYPQPRINATYTLNQNWKIKAAYGIYYQFVKRVIREDIFQGSRDFWVLADGNKLPVAAATHYIAGFSWENKNWLFDAETYYKPMDGLSEYSVRIRPSPRAITLDEKFASGSGKAKGIDLLLQKKYGALNGWISYSLAEVKYNFADFGKPFYANQDVRHEFKIVGIYNWAKHWDLAATWIFASGRPYTAPTGGYQLTLLDNTKRDFTTVTDKNGVRLPDYHRLDIAFTYKWNGEGAAPRNISLSLFNVYNRSNVWYKEFQIQSGQVIETNVNYLAFTPNISASWNLH